MIEIQIDQVPRNLPQLFEQPMPQAQRCFGVLQGSLLGRILVDDPAAPTWAAVWESADGSLYLGGRMNAQIVAELMAGLRRHAQVLVGLWPDDLRWAWLPPHPDYDGFAIDFQKGVIGSHLDTFLTWPEGCEICRVDEALAARSPGFKDWCAHFGGVEAYLAEGVAHFMLKDGEIVSEASADPPANGVMEMGTGTHEAHRQNGYATAVCAYTIQACERMGRITHWNCAKQNLASAALARKLGYADAREYRVVCWNRGL